MTKKFNFSEYCDNWFLSNSSRLKPSSCAKYYVNIEKHIKPYFGAEQLCGITSEKVDEFTRTLIYEKKLSVKTTRDILVLFHSIFVYAGSVRRAARPILRSFTPKGAESRYVY